MCFLFWTPNTGYKRDNMCFLFSRLHTKKKCKAVLKLNRKLHMLLSVSTICSWSWRSLHHLFCKYFVCITLYQWYDHFSRYFHQPASFRTEWEAFEITTVSKLLQTFQRDRRGYSKESKIMYSYVQNTKITAKLKCIWRQTCISKKLSTVKKLFELSLNLPLFLLLQYFFHPSFAIQQKYLNHHQGLAVSGVWWKEKAIDTRGKWYQLTCTKEKCAVDKLSPYS